uniref:Uncharacterized protein n=1 Tax=Romanomermis culicivorax TaxID=13658 RepID=A0A915JW03_ROMCU
MTMPSTSTASATDEPLPYQESINVNEGYVRWAEQQPHQKDLSFCCDAALRFFNNPVTSFLQSDVLAYTALEAYYPLLFFLAFRCYGFVPEAYNALPLFPHDSLDPTKIDHLAKRNSAQWFSQPQTIGVYNTPQASHCIETAKKKRKEQKDEWNKFGEVSDDEDPLLQPKSLFNDPKRPQAAVTWAIKGGPTDRLIKLLNFPVSPRYKSAIHDRIQFQTDWALPPISHQVDGDWFRRLTTCMPFATLLAPPCSTTKYAYVNDFLIGHAQTFHLATCTAFYNCMWYGADSNPQMHLTDWMN